MGWIRPAHCFWQDNREIKKLGTGLMAPESSGREIIQRF
jgi:hypothetical protein